jgi:hypothetical protein
MRSRHTDSGITAKLCATCLSNVLGQVLGQHVERVTADRLVTPSPWGVASSRMQASHRGKLSPRALRNRPCLWSEASEGLLRKGDDADLIVVDGDQQSDHAACNGCAWWCSLVNRSVRGRGRISSLLSWPSSRSARPQRDDRAVAEPSDLAWRAHEASRQRAGSGAISGRGGRGHARLASPSMAEPANRHLGEDVPQVPLRRSAIRRGDRTYAPAQASH